MEWHEKTIEEVVRELKTNKRSGLTEEEAKKRQREQGENQLVLEQKKKGVLRRFLSQMNDFMVIVLIAAAVASFAVSYLNGDGDFLDSAIILLIVCLNGILGVVQESKAEKALEALKKLSAPKAKVLRDGKIQEIKGTEVVAGDVLILETGNFVCADGRIFEENSLKIEESALTGESLPVEKESGALFRKKMGLGDQKNMVFSSSYVTYGKGKVLVTAIGMDTEVGNIAKLISDHEESMTPLQKKLEQTGKLLGMGALGICFVIFLMGILRHQDPFALFMTSVSLAVAAIPEGLPAIVTIVLAIGTQRMSKKNSIIRRLPAVETLGSASVICSDKTGTLTQNKMKVIKVSDHETSRGLEIEKRKLILMLTALCNDSRKDGEKTIGEPTEVALLEGAEEAGVKVGSLAEGMPRIDEIPFSSERKKMTTLHSVIGKGYLSVTKGAVDVLLSNCTACLENGGQVPFDEKKKRMTERQAEEMAESALRVMGVAFREWKEKPSVVEKLKWEENLIFAGMIGMIDPPRPEVKESVAICKKAGIRPVMITGDHVLTAKAIAKELDIFSDKDGVLTGEELERMDDETLKKVVGDTTVFARVSPVHKVRIVKAYQSQGQVVAMTGDGVNDAPALRVADIGCAMGKNGTEVAKGAADMILADDNFATIVEAVKEGRGIYDNICKAVHFLISSNIGEIVTVFVAMCFRWATPLLPIQLLWVNLVTDSLPAIALGLEPPEKDIMERKPKKVADSMFSDGLGWRIVLEGCMIGLLALIAFGIGHIHFDTGEQHIIGRTMAFSVLSISQLIHAFNMRTEHSLFSIPFFGNLYLIGAFLICLAMEVTVIMVPILATIFRVQPLTLQQWGIVSGLAMVPILVVELEKWCMCITQKNKIES